VDSGKFNVSLDKGLHATQLNGNNVAYCRFGSVKQANYRINESYELTGMNTTPTDEILILLDDNRDNYIVQDSYYYIYIKGDKIGLLKKYYLNLPPFNIIPIWEIYSPLYTVVAGSHYNFSYSYEYISHNLNLYINNGLVRTVQFDTNKDLVYVSRDNNMSRYAEIQVNNLNIGVLSHYENMRLKMNDLDLTDTLGFAQAFTGIILWGIPEDFLPWWAHLLLITLWEFALAGLLIANYIRGS
jgi:hypothetical protein